MIDKLERHNNNKYIFVRNIIRFADHRTHIFVWKRKEKMGEKYYFKYINILKISKINWDGERNLR